MSSVDIVFRAVRDIPLLRGLSDDQVRSISLRAERVMFAPGDTLVVEGNLHASTLILVDGDVECVSGVGQYNGEQIAPGSVLTEMAMVVDVEATTTVIARSPVKAIRIHQSDLLDQLENDPDVSERLIVEVSGRLRETAADLRAIEQEWSSPPLEPQGGPLLDVLTPRGRPVPSSATAPFQPAH